MLEQPHVCAGVDLVPEDDGALVLEVGVAAHPQDLLCGNAAVQLQQHEVAAQQLGRVAHQLRLATAWGEGSASTTPTHMIVYTYTYLHISLCLAGICTHANARDLNVL